MSRALDVFLSKELAPVRELWRDGHFDQEDVQLAGMPTRRLKLMADYDCFPLWDVDEPANVDPEELPLTADLKSALLVWADAYDRTLNQRSPLDSCFAGPAEEAAFEAEGRRLCKELRAQLGSAYEVWYYSDQQAGLLDRG